MKLFYCFVAEMVISQPIGKRFEGSASEKWPLFLYDDEEIQDFRDFENFETKPDSRIELPPPILDEINGIEMTEMESISINGRPQPPPQPCHFNYCPRDGWESLDSNDGTGDHESFNRPESRCIQVRVKYSHQPSLNLPVTFVYYDGNSWNWGKSAQYGFHCFHGWKSNGKCDDFEFRTFFDC